MKVVDYPAIFPEDHQKWVYWGRGYEVVSGDDWVVVIVNSCHFHSTQLANEFERGRIGDAALLELTKRLSDVSKDKAFRLVLMHHPPINHEEAEVQLGREPMFNGISFLRALEDSGLDWLVIHGHKHFQRLIRHGDSDHSPMIFGAGSFGASLKGAVATRTKNQFYILELETTRDVLEQERLKARFTSLYWNLTQWNRVEEESQGLPDKCGFDLAKRVEVPKLAKAIQTVLDGGAPYSTWEELVGQIEELKYLTPGDIRALKKTLQNINIIYSPENLNWFPQQVSKK